MHGTIDPTIREQALRDLVVRARPGIFLYATIWLVSGVWVGLVDTNPMLFFGNLVLLMASATMRSWQTFSLTQSTEIDIYRTENAIVITILINALHWGVLAAWLMHYPDFGDLRYVTMVITAAIAVGGTSMLCISPKVRIYYPLCVFAPTAIAGLLVGGSENYMLFILLLLSVRYTYSASELAANDYYRAITNIRLANERTALMERQAAIDALTGLSNRRHLEERLREEWKRCARRSAPLSALMIDLDHFKSLNDTYGHLFGDYCLEEVSAALRAVPIREFDLLARYGGEEFILILPDTDEAGAQNLADNIISEIAELNLNHNDQVVRVTCSVGIATVIPDYNDSYETLLKRSDLALYEAKGQGRNCRCLYANSMAA